MGLLIQETWVNATEGYQSGKSDVYETPWDTPGKLFRALRREWGRCVGKIYVDRDDPKDIGAVQHVGWCFQKREKYTDTGEPYILETWVSVHTRMPETKLTEFLADLGRG